MRTLLKLVVLSTLAGPVAAVADGSILLAARAGITRPFGDTANGQELADYADWAFPLEAQAQLRLGRQLAVGAYGRYAPTSLASSCSSCSANDVGFGAVVEYRFGAGLEGGPWIGAFAGWERLRTEVPTVLGKVSSTFSGLEGGATGGVDFEVGGMTLGPYVQLSLGQFSRLSTTGASASIFDKGMHGFFGGGVRLTLLL